MNKQQLTDAIWERTDKTVSKERIYTILGVMASVVQEQVATGDRVKIVGFGSFSARKRKEREGRNPQTGEPCTIPAATVPCFSPGKEFKDLVDEMN